MADAIFQAIEAAQGDRPWGAVLDAGTGAHSLTWLRGLETERWTAVTGSASMAKTAKTAKTATGLEAPRPNDAVVIGNWRDPAFLANQQFDVVLADYLLGAIAGFAPYFQDQLFERLRPHVAPHGRLYVVGLQPSPERCDAPWGALMLEVERLRDACIRLCGDRCYREYPLDWVERSLATSGFVVRERRRFPIRPSLRSVERQLEVGRKKLPRIERRLARALGKQADALLAKAKTLDRQAERATFGEDYLVVAEPQ